MPSPPTTSESPPTAAVAADGDTENFSGSTPSNSEEDNTDYEPSAAELSIAAHLEQIIWDIRDALNGRNYDRNSHPWKLFIPAYKCEAVAYMSKPQVGMSEYLKDLERLANEFPELHFHFRDVSIHVDLEAQRADCFVNEEVSGYPPGMVRRSVGVCKFRLLHGVWKCIGYYNSRGMDAD